jgi:hypothetical protein
MITRTRTIMLPEWVGKPVEEEQAGWPVIKRFEPSEDDFQAALADLSHRDKAIVQGPGLKKIGQLNPGEVLWNGEAFVCGLKPDEAVVFDLKGPVEPNWPDEYHTDMTEGWVLLGLWGFRSLEIMQRLVTVDIERPEARDSFFLVTRCHGVALQVLNPKGPEPGFFLACDRSHGQNLFDSLFHVGQHLGLTVVGLEGFQKWFERLSL